MQNWQWAWQSTLNGALTTTQASAPLRHCWASYYWWAISCDMCVCVCVRACVCVLCVCVCVWVCVCVCVSVCRMRSHPNCTSTRAHPTNPSMKAHPQLHDKRTSTSSQTTQHITHCSMHQTVPCTRSFQAWQWRMTHPHKPHNTLHTIPRTRSLQAWQSRMTHPHKPHNTLHTV